MSNAPDATSWREGRSSSWAIGLLFLLYAGSRVLSLDVLPIFLDEAVHIQWAERLFSEGRILRPVSSGRLLAVVAYGAALPFEERLWVSRLLAVLAGALILAATMLLAQRLFGARAALVAGLLYVFSPFALVYDRLALSDGFLSASITGLMLSTWALVHKRRSAFSMTTGFLVLAICSKVSALLFLAVVPMGALAAPSQRRTAFRDACLACAVGLLCASPMLWFFVSNSGEIASQHVVDPVNASSLIVSTLGDMRTWVLSYFTPPLLLAAALSLLLVRDGRALWLGAAVALPFLLFAVLSQPWSARYVLPTLPPLLILVAGGIEAVAGRLRAGSSWTAFGLTVMLSLPGLSFGLDLLRDPVHAPFPADDRHQLVTGWPSGYGVRELSARLKRESSTGPITAYVDSGGLRTVPAGLAILMGRSAAVSLVEGDFGSAAFRASMVADAQTRAIFAIMGPRSPSLDFTAVVSGAAVERVEVYSRPGGEWAATLFRLGAAR